MTLFDFAVRMVHMQSSTQKPCSQESNTIIAVSTNNMEYN